MKTRIAVLAVVVALLLLGAVAPARSGGNGLTEVVVIQPGVASGGGYRLSGLSWQISGTASGGGYRLLETSAPSLTGSGCCCSYLPCVLRR